MVGFGYDRKAEPQGVLRYGPVTPERTQGKLVFLYLLSGNEGKIQKNHRSIVQQNKASQDPS
jgi:hypothetical protein